MKKKNKFDNLVCGVTPGIILPGIAMIVSWIILSDLSFSGYVHRYYMMDRLSNLISLCAIPNLLLFFIFIWLEKYRSARGVIFATLVVAIVMLIVKYLV
ncbi:hypothetical protein ACFLT1_00335 [Bacteroidota bacterium]